MHISFLQTKNKFIKCQTIKQKTPSDIFKNERLVDKRRKRQDHT